MPAALRVKPVLILALGLALAGCNSSSPPPLPVDPEPVSTVQTPPEDQPDDPAPSVPEAVKPDYAGLLETAAGQLKQETLDDAKQSIARLRAARKDLSSAEVERLAELEAAFQERRDVLADAERERTLETARKALDDGEYEDATAALERVLAAAPTEEQSAAANRLKDSIEDRRRAQRALNSAMRLLASDKRADIKAARTQLWEKADAALPLLLKSLSSEEPILVENTLETLRMFNKPERSLPAMVGVLSRTTQAESWPAAIKEIHKTNHPGAGEPLLTLALSAETPEQRAAALSALSGVVDAPARSLVALLPMIYQDGPDLASALTAAQRAMEQHKQTDLAARRGLDMELTEEQQQQLAGLPERLQQIITAGAGKTPPPLSAQAAQNLAVVTRQIVPLPLTGAKVTRVVGEDPLALSTGVLDGVWQEADPKTMWKHPIDKQASIVLDLGSERTVTAVRIWNYNETGISYRGWKEVEIFVSQTPALLAPVAEGILPKAPGAVATADYSVTLQVPFVRGRYIKLQPRSYWQPDGPSGLTEVQILGF